MQILLIEDNRSDAKVITDQLNTVAGYEVSATGSLGSALTLLRNRRYDTILLDLGLMDSIGLDTLVAVRREANGAPILVVSGYEDLALAVQCFRAGAAAFLLKGEYRAVELEREIHLAQERARLAGTKLPA
jgi:DNA-binding response OmpR family regulator